MKTIELKLYMAKAGITATSIETDNDKVKGHLEYMKGLLNDLEEGNTTDTDFRLTIDLCRNSCKYMLEKHKLDEQEYSNIWTIDNAFRSAMKEIPKGD